MKYFTVVTLFACVLVCANAQFNALQGSDDKIPLPDEIRFPFDEGTDEPDTDEPATEDYKDGDDETGLVDEKDDFDDDDDDDDKDDGVYNYNYYGSRHRQWGRRQRKGTYRHRGGQRHRGKGYCAIQKCFDSFINCTNTTNSIRSECIVKLKDCLQDYKKNRTWNGTLAVRNCWKNCTEKLFDCLENTSTSSIVCVNKKDTCGTKCMNLIVGSRSRHGGSRVWSRRCKGGRSGRFPNRSRSSSRRSYRQRG